MPDTALELRHFRPGDEPALVALWNRAHTPYGGYVRRTEEYWRWCVLDRPGVNDENIQLLEGPAGIVAYGVLAASGTVIELAIDPDLVGADRERVAGRVVEALEVRCLTLGDEMIVFELPRTDGPLNRMLTGAGYRQEASESLSLMVLDMARLLEAILRHRQPRFPHGWAPLFVIELEPGYYRFHPEHLLELVMEPEVSVRVIDETEATQVTATSTLESRAMAAAERAHAEGFDRSADPDPACRIRVDRSTLSDIIFRRDSFDAALASGRLHVEPASGEQDARTMMSFLSLKSPWFTPNADGR